MNKVSVRKTILLSLIIVPLLASAQYDIGLKLNLGGSQINTKESFATIKKATYFRPSGQCGFFFNFILKKNFSIGSEVLFVQIAGEQHYYQEKSGDLFLTYTESKQHISYIGIPVYFGYSVKKLNINLGFQANLALVSGGKEMVIHGMEQSENDLGSLDIEHFDFGLRPGLIYNASEKLAIELNYYYGFLNINNFPESNEWKVQQITLGLRYILTSIDNN